MLWAAGWTYESTPERINSKADAAAKIPCEQPTENHMTTLANGSIFAVFRSENTNYPLGSTVSNDEYEPAICGQWPTELSLRLTALSQHAQPP